MKIHKLFTLLVVLVGGLALTTLTEASTANVCEAQRKNLNKYQCTRFTGSAWTEENAKKACAEGSVTFGQAGSYHQYRCDPKSFKGVCRYKKRTALAYSRCAEGDNFFSCTLSGGSWTKDPKTIEQTCFPKAPTDKALVDQSKSIEEILEYGEIYGACDRYFADPENASRRLMLLCGKWMYFYEHFNYPSVPTAINTFYQNNFPETVGQGWTKRGMFLNPYSEKKLPIGLADAPNLPNTDIPTINWTCASCHFGQAPDGRFVVGLGGNFDYGLQQLIISLPTHIVGLAEEEAAPEAIAALAPVIQEWQNNPKWLDFFLKFLPLAAAEGDEVMNIDQQKVIATWGRGIIDPLLFPGRTNDFVHSPLKMPNVYGIPTAKMFSDMGFDPNSHKRMGWAGTTGDMLRFSQGFVALGPDSLDNWPEPRLRPLNEYILSLKAPKNPQYLDPVRVEYGKQLFQEKGCLGCHNGPNYMGMEVYDFEEIGTDPTHKWQLDAAQDFGLPLPNLTPETPLKLTHKISPPRLDGLWTQDKFLHNGSIHSLADLFCLDSDRPTIEEQPFSDAGHRYTCDELTRDEKIDLMEFLLSI